MAFSTTAEPRPMYRGSSDAPASRRRRASDASDPAAPRDLTTLPDPARFRSVASNQDPFEIPDLVEELEEAILLVVAHVHAAGHRLLTYIAQFDRLRGWELAGHRDCAAWLAFRAGYERGAALEWVRTARALGRMPLTGEAMARGELSFSKVRCLTRAVDDLEASEDPDAEGALVEFACYCTTAQLERQVRTWRELQVHDPEELERRRIAGRSFSVFPDSEGMYRIRGTLPADVGALLMRAVEAASDALFHSGRDWAGEGGRWGPGTEEITPSQRRADAVALLAERALAAGFGGLERQEEEAADDLDELEERGEKDAGAGAPTAESGSSCGCSHPPVRSTRAERYLALLHVDAGVMGEGVDEEDGGLDDPGACHLEDGVPISAETARRLTCDGSVVHVLRGSEGSVLDIGRRSRTIPPAIRRALAVRDGGCRWPGCTSRYIEGHHVKHWALGGETKLSNLLSLCLHHHRCVHEGGFRVQARADGTFRIYDRLGWPLPDRPPPPPPLPEQPLEALVRAHRRRGLAPDPEAPSATFERESDIPAELMHRFWNVLDPG